MTLTILVLYIERISLTESYKIHMKIINFSKTIRFSEDVLFLSRVILLHKKLRFFKSKN